MIFVVEDFIFYNNINIYLNIIYIKNKINNIISITHKTILRNNIMSVYPQKL